MVYEFGDMGVVMIQHRPANLMCSGGPVREGVVVFDLVNGTALHSRLSKPRAPPCRKFAPSFA